jgi:DivIVA domain-containing protein
MEISPADVRKKQFRSALRGVDSKEVREFLYEVAIVLEGLYTERELFKSKVSELEERATEFRQMEQVLTQTLEEAHETAERLRKSAKEDAERIKAQAKKEAETILNHAKEELEGIRATIRSLNGQKLAFLEEMETTINSYRRILERLKDDTVTDETTN